jgi:hypothetical protein
MTVKELQGKLLEAYSAKKLNRIILSLINFQITVLMIFCHLLTCHVLNM